MKYRKACGKLDNKIYYNKGIISDIYIGMKTYIEVSKADKSIVLSELLVKQLLEQLTQN